MTTATPRCRLEVAAATRMATAMITIKDTITAMRIITAVHTNTIDSGVSP